MAINIVLFILIMFWPFFVGFGNEFWHDLKVWYIQKRITYLCKRRVFGGSVKHSVKFAKLINKANKLNIKINVTIDSPGSASMGVMRINFIKHIDQCQ